MSDTKEGEAAFAALTKDGKSPFKPGFDAIFKAGDLPAFAERLGRPLDRPVVDKTEIKGQFWFQLEWKPDLSQNAKTFEKLHAGPSLLGALEEQLGLRLETQSASLEILVIDQIEKPSEN